ncbi:MAG: hypothetical protein N2B57_08100 [Planctomycetales bacterium]
MSIRFYQVAVVCFWISTTTWLLLTKVMPVLYRGEPPNHHAATVSQLIDNLPVIWDLKWNFHSVGWAANHVVQSPEGQLELLSRLQFSDWPKADAATSSWILEQLSNWGGHSGNLYLQLTNRSLLDENHQLKELKSSIYLVEEPKAKDAPWMEIQGTVDGNTLMLSFHLGDRMLGERSIPLRPHSLISSEISPHGYMPRLRIRQSWTTYQISPLRPPTSPQGTIVATVERYDPMIWNGRLVETLLVVYRKDEGSGSRSADEYLGRLWVRPDNGMVLKQEIILLGSRFTLQRREDEAAKIFARDLQEDWAGTPSLPDLKTKDGDLKQGQSP